MNAYSPCRTALRTSQRSPHALESIAAYAMGATLWAPTLALVAWPFEDVFTGVLPGLPMTAALRIVAVMWMLRFVLYIVGARHGWNYGYGINGVIVNQRLSLAHKVRRITHDWFGILLMIVWTLSMMRPLARLWGGF